MLQSLNERSLTLLESYADRVEDLGIGLHPLPSGATVWDFGVHARGSLAAGILLARLCMADRATVSLSTGDIGGTAWPVMTVQVESPVEACLLSQYAGWQISVGKYFAMGSGPMRAVAAREEVFDKLEYRECPTRCLGVLESRKLPDDAVLAYLAEKTNLPVEQIMLCVAPTASLAGNAQVVARSVETALHKLFELKFDVRRIVSGLGSAPLSPVAKDDLTGIGRTNDAILYGGRVTLWVTGDDESIAEIGPQVPSQSSPMYGKPFLDIFEEAGRDFYLIDPHLFSPAEIVFQNIETGTVQHFGSPSPEIL
ncbi:MAG: methenyltetrahydromethanopterin cyclohydrolase, partial [Planctomycetota bacterium]|nr:methenyltetrahydromethanopterin cyclohydrolase [Planctomycetota bacterium]